MKTLLIASTIALIQFSLLASIVPKHSQRNISTFIVKAQGMSQEFNGSRMPAVIAVNK